MTVARIGRWIGHALAALLLLVLVLGSIGAWQLPDGQLHAASVLGAIAWLLLAVVTLARPGSFRASWKGTLQFVACWLIFPLFKAIHEVVITRSLDAMLLHVDRFMWGGTSLPGHLLGWVHPWLSEILALAYFLFFFVVLLPVIGFSFCRRRPEARAFFVGLAAMYLFGFAGYLVIPASGPYQAFPALFPYPPAGGPITAFVADVVKMGVTGMDAFPSLHSGISLYVLGFFALGGYKHTAAVLAPVTVGIITATLYLRYHYGIDDVCGVLLALMVLAFVQRFRKEHAA